jgi:AraC-like DNA-binding protein
MRAFYPRIEDLRDAVADGASRVGTPFFPTPVIEDPALTHVIRALHRALERPSTSLERETRSILAASMLALRHGRLPSARARATGNSAAVRRAVDFIEASYADNISLAQLAAMTQLSSFHLVRVFSDSLGMPPHAFQTSVRLRHARVLLGRGHSPARVAAQTGFTDQSHLHRHFVRAFGITPGQFASATRTYNHDDRARS